VLLTNAVHFGRDATASKALRREFSAAVATAFFPVEPAASLTAAPVGSATCLAGKAF
jgi:hypothetical protein